MKTIIRSYFCVSLLLVGFAAQAESVCGYVVIDSYGDVRLSDRIGYWDRYSISLGGKTGYVMTDEPNRQQCFEGRFESMARDRFYIYYRSR